MTFPRYGVHLDFTEFFGRECAIFTILPASQVERLSVSKLSSTFAECWKMWITNKLEKTRLGHLISFEPFGLEKPVVKLQSACFEKLIF